MTDKGQQTINLVSDRWKKRAEINAGERMSDRVEWWCSGLGLGLIPRSSAVLFVLPVTRGFSAPSSRSPSTSKL